MTPGRTIYLGTVKATYLGMTTTGLVKLVTAGRAIYVRRDRVTWNEHRKFRRAA